MKNQNCATTTARRIIWARTLDIFVLLIVLQLPTFIVSGGSSPTFFQKLPKSGEVSGVENDLVRLCATVSGLLYDHEKFKSSKNFEKKLLELAKDTPYEDDICVRFFQNGIRFVTTGGFLTPNPPTFTGMIVGGDTLILGWRGTQNLIDVFYDFTFRIRAPKDWGKEYKEAIQLHGSMLLLQERYLNNHGKDIKNYIEGNYSKKVGGMRKNGTPIKRIILTGHSLGGGLAQVAHLVLTVPGSRWYVADKVEVRTIAFAAPMTTHIKPECKEIPLIKDFLVNSVKPNMTNIVFDSDTIPHGYAHSQLMSTFLDAFEMELAKGLQFVTEFGQQILNRKESWKHFSHIGKVFRYDNSNTVPKLVELSDKKYKVPGTSVVDAAFDAHMRVINPGCALPAFKGIS